ncbi:MAG TPA: hypothetical protein VIH81_10725 [Roseiarcus sp.]
MMTDEEKAATRAGLHAKANGMDPSKPAAPAGGSSDEPGYLMQAARGLARGVASDIPGAASSAFATQDDAGLVEQGARYAGEYGPMLIPGLDFGLGAKFGTKAAEWALQHGPELQTLAKAVGPDAARRMIHGLWDTAPKVGRAASQGAIGGALMDPEHPLEGAATGAVTAPAFGAARAGFRGLSPTVKHAAVAVPSAAATTGAIIGAKEMMGGRRGEEWPVYFGARQAMSPLLALAAAATGKPAIAGGAGALTRKLTGDDDDGGQR